MNTRHAADSSACWRGFRDDRGAQIATPGPGVLGWVRARWPGLIAEVAASGVAMGSRRVRLALHLSGVSDMATQNAIIEAARRDAALTPTLDSLPQEDVE